MKQAVNMPCLVCGSGDSRLLHALSYPDQHYPGLFEMRECAGCGLLFNSPRLSDAEIARLYDADYYVFQERERDAARRVALLASQTLGVAAHYCEARDVLELGCAKGYLLAQLRAQGWQVRGVELAAAAADFARQRFGLDVYAGTLAQALAQPGFQPASVLLCTDVIEHVPAPLALLQDMRRALKPRGWLVLGTPNADADQRRALGPRWLGFNPFHIFLFNRANLGRLLEQAGFELVRAYTYANDDPPQPATTRWRDAIRDRLRDRLRETLRASGLLPVLRRARAGMLALADSPVSLQGLQAELASGQLPALHSYAASADARSARGAACRGDNLVLIARARS
ncbi:class I SAM-dependent methyltransferase [Paucibacter soli]|uniref:class I SAM-dependent methyltransferase n=1 Tax=Paucibacter soli TaxID=3133433 RepID=UPI0030AE7B1D